jgi:hypothetical protein
MKKSIYLFITILLVGGITAAQPTNQKSVKRNSLAPETVVTVAAPVQGAAAGANFTIPLTVSDTTGLGVIAYQFDMHYDPAVITPQANAVSVAGTISSGLAAVYNPISPGILKVVVYGANPLNGGGTLLTLNFRSVGTVGAVSPLRWVNLMFNEGNPVVNGADGQVRLISSPSTSTNIAFTGRESSAGTYDFLNHIHRGNTFVMTSDDLTNAASITASFDLIPADEPDALKVVSGHWTVMVYEGGVYVGSIYGDVADGRVHDIVDDATGVKLQRTVSATFRIVGGIGRYADTVPEEAASGQYTSTTNYPNGKSTTASLSYVL